MAWPWVRRALYERVRKERDRLEREKAAIVDRMLELDARRKDG